jgi:two-component system phosphate regulon response regulator PhoB
MQGNEPSSKAANTRSSLALVVDDEAAIAETLAEFLAELGYTTLVAANGEEALTLARQRWPRLVFTDLMMPHVNGVELIAALHAEAEARHITPPFIVLLTAAGKRAAERTGADRVILKPFELEQIEQVLDGLPR